MAKIRLDQRVFDLGLTESRERARTSVMAGLVYVILAIMVKISGVRWIDKLMPPVIIGPTVAIIGLSLAGNAISDLGTSSSEGGSVYVCLICGLVTLFVTVLVSTYGKRMMKLIPFIIGILAGYFVASLFALIGNNTGYAVTTIDGNTESSNASVNYGTTSVTFETE